MKKSTVLVSCLQEAVVTMSQTAMEPREPGVENGSRKSEKRSLQNFQKISKK
jgi:hypothetical protein